MSSNTGREPSGRPWSIALRLTIWYATAAFALVLFATGYLYFALVRQLDHEDDHFLEEKVQEVRGILASRPHDRTALELEVRGGGADKFYIRVSFTGDKRDTIETPGMAKHLPWEVFPDANAEDFAASDGRPYRLITTRDSASGAVIQAAMNRAYDDEFLAEYREQLSYVLGASLFAAVAGGYWIARRGLRPIADVTETARRIRPSHLNERIDFSGLPAEVRDLADTFNHMLDRLEESFNRLSQFSADIAHELRTPVNNLRGEAEVALGRERTPEEYREVLGSSLEECGRLSRLIDSLLFLARAEDPKTELVASKVRMIDVLRTVQELYDPAAAEAGIRLAIEADADATVSGDRQLLHQAISNLVSNAIAHTPSGGTITLFARQVPTATEFGVRDTGPGIAEKYLPHIFERLYRVDPVRSSTSGRVGLGLAIVKGIAELHRGSVEAVSPIGEGLMVKLTIAEQ